MVMIKIQLLNYKRLHQQFGKRRQTKSIDVRGPGMVADSVVGGSRRRARWVTLSRAARALSVHRILLAYKTCWFHLRRLGRCSLRQGQGLAI